MGRIKTKSMENESKRVPCKKQSTISDVKIRQIINKITLDITMYDDICIYSLNIYTRNQKQWKRCFLLSQSYRPTVV